MTEGVSVRTFKIQSACKITLLLEKHYGIRLANPAEAKPIFYSVATLADFIRKNRPQ